MLLYIIPIFCLTCIVTWVTALASVLRAERDLIWLVFILLLPPLGIPLYILNFKVLDDEKQGLTAMRRRHKARRRIAEIRAMAVAGEALPAHIEELASIHFDLGDWQECLQVLKHVLEQDAENSRAQYEAALALCNIGKHEAAIPHFEYLFEEDSGFRSWTGALRYADALEHLDRHREACDIYKHVYCNLTIPEVAFRYGNSLIRTGNRDEGIRIISQMVDDYTADMGHNVRRDARWVAVARDLLNEMGDKQ